jgi:hypothetical protein
MSADTAHALGAVVATLQLLMLQPSTGDRPMSHLDREQQLFVHQQIRNWVFGRYDVFSAINVAWWSHGAQAYFWH